MESDPVVPIVPGGGNPNPPPGIVPEKKKQPSPYKYFVFTLENHTAEDITNLKSSSSSIVPQLGFQEEDTPTNWAKPLHRICKDLVSSKRRSVRLGTSRR